MDAQELLEKYTNSDDGLDGTVCSEEEIVCMRRIDKIVEVRNSQSIPLDTVSQPTPLTGIPPPPSPAPFAESASLGDDHIESETNSVEVLLADDMPEKLGEMEPKRTCVMHEPS